MSQQAAKRRRRQASIGFRHICKAKRPKYKVRSIEVSSHRDKLLAERRKAMMARSSRSK